MPMDTKSKLNQALKTAMREGDQLGKSVLRMALAAIKNAEIDKRAELDDPGVLGILQKEVKSRRETIEGAEQAGRDDLIETAQSEIAILESFLPQPLTPDELAVLVKETIAEVGASSLREMGLVMKTLIPKVQGRADGKDVSLAVKQALSD